MNLEMLVVLAMLVPLLVLALLLVMNRSVPFLSRRMVSLFVACGIVEGLILGVNVAKLRSPYTTWFAAICGVLYFAMAMVLRRRADARSER